MYRSFPPKDDDDDNNNNKQKLATSTSVGRCCDVCLSAPYGTMNIDDCTWNGRSALADCFVTSDVGERFIVGSDVEVRSRRIRVRQWPLFLGPAGSVCMGLPAADRDVTFPLKRDVSVWTQNPEEITSVHNLSNMGATLPIKLNKVSRSKYFANSHSAELNANGERLERHVGERCLQQNEFNVFGKKEPC
ncbi:hypothetical protein F2P81_018660 [Scophthalmus maximus]|uniref:Uncharacterized protein n=1 Tax=Scophthalmus maximus TaxID=52904 RepID=A0A6A4SAZ1_SCOMX|nr:hypothetical protein F2P81_018660 [Scophthalmus maximus]